MSKQICPSCGAEMITGALFCQNCGIPLNAAAPAPAPVPTPIIHGTPAPVVTAKAPKKKSGRAVGVVKEIFTIIFCLTLVLTLIITSAVAMFQAFIAPSNISAAVGKIDLTDIFDSIVDEFNIGGMLNEEMEQIYEFAENRLEVDRFIDKAINSSTIKDFVTETIFNYASDIIYSNGKGVIDKDELLEVIDEFDRKYMSKLPGRELLDQAEWLDIEKLVSDIDFYSFSVDALRHRFPLTFGLVSAVLSPIPLYIMIAIDALLVLGVILLNLRRRFAGGLIHRGVTGIISGALIWGASAFAHGALNTIIPSIRFLEDIVAAFVNSPFRTVDLFGMITLIAGAVLLVVGITIRVIAAALKPKVVYTA